MEGEDSKHLILDDISHAIRRSFMTGHFKRVQQKCYALSQDHTLYKCELDHSPALLKIIDEIICNCCDVYLKTGTVTEIKINIDPEDGTVSIYNTGNGIPVYEHEEGTRIRGRKCYWPECCFGMFRAGSNLDVDDSHSAAGINGLGAKLTGIHSDWLELITVDQQRKIKYCQVFKDCLRNPTTPILEKYTKKPFTHVSFAPMYEERFFYNINEKPKELNEIIDIIRYRVIHLSMFLGCCVDHGGSRIKLFYQDVEVKVRDTRAFMEIFNTNNPGDLYNIKTTVGDPKKAQHFIDYSVIIAPSTKYRTTSVVNGIMVKDGTHVTYLKRKINTKMKELMTGKDRDAGRKIDCSSNIVVVASAWLCVDNWGTQTKDTLTIPEVDLKAHNVDERVITTMAKKLISISKATEVKKDIIPKKVSKTVVYDKYTPPKKKSASNTLILVEGDSAISLVRAGLNAKCSGLNFDNTGIFSLGGVPINVAKTTVKEGPIPTSVTNEGSDSDSDDDDLKIIEKASQKFWDSKIFGALVQALNLDRSKKYISPGELKSLHFNKVIIAVDQDLDGRGNICSLVLQMFYRYWPHLYSHNYIQYWNSPIVRVVKKTTGKVVKEFKYENDFKKWKESSPEGTGADCDILYIKGLATHDNKYVKDMFTRFNSDVFALTTDKDTKKMFDLYFGYGKEYSDQRKVVLQTEVRHLTDDEVTHIERTHTITCNRHLDLNTKEFQIAAGKRTLSGLDGMTPVRRKIFTVMFTHNITKPMKLFQIGARAASELAYHHGDKSINDAVLKMAQDFLGSNYYPLLKGDGQMGTRNKRGGDAGSARYISAALNKNIVDVLFTKEDVHILPKQFDDGILIEPQYYIPALPLCILENNKAVAPGWSLNTVGRDLDTVVKVLVKLAEGKTITVADKKLPPYVSKTFKGKMELLTEHQGTKQSVVKMTGHWYREKPGSNTIIIDELPITTTPHKYYIDLSKDEEHIADIRNYSDNHVHIEVDFKNGAIEHIGEANLDKYLGMESTVCEQFNFINEKGILEHFESAYTVLYRCFELNKRKMTLKINRESLLLKYLILREQNIIKFMENDEVKNLYKKKEVDINKFLSIKQYALINSSILNTHYKYTTEELEKELAPESTDIKTGYNYLKQVSFGEVSDENIYKRTKKLQEMESRLKELEAMAQEKPFPGASEYIRDVKKAHTLLRHS